MAPIVWETMKPLTDRQRFERLLAVVILLQRSRFAEIIDIIRQSITTICQDIPPDLETRLRAFLRPDCRRWIFSIPRVVPTV